jgi:hypothetical protein
MVQATRQKGAGIFDTIKGAITGKASDAVTGLTSKATDALAGTAQQAQQRATDFISTQAKEAEIAASVAALKTSGMTNVQAAAAEKIIRSSGGVKQTVSGSTSFLQRYITNPLKATGSFIMANKMTIIYVLFALVVLGLAIWYFFKKPAAPAAQKAQETANTLAGVASTAPATMAETSPLTEKPVMIEGDSTAIFPAPSIETFQDVPSKSVDPAAATMTNLQPLTISQAGYLGPPRGGRFDPETAIVQALRAGFRSFVLQIDYLDTAKGAGFAPAGQPTLVYNGPNGALLSANTGSIEKVAETIAKLAYRPDVPNSNTPVILYLHVLRAPSAVRSPDSYLKYLSQIAKGLAPLAPTHLGLTPLGTFHRQKRESDLLNLPLTSLEGKTIILSNADTSMFRAPRQTAGKRYDPAEDLDYWVNMRVYLDNEDQLIGVSRLADSDVKVAAVVVRLNDLMPQVNARADAFALKGKRRFVIAMPNPLENPTPKELSRAINEFGVNMVPLDIFTPAPEEARALVMEYTGMSYRPKPAALRNV